MTPEQLTLSGLKSARAVAARWARKYPRLADDFLGESLLAVWRCVLGGGYDPSRGAFETWAWRWANFACADLARREAPKGFRPRGAGSAPTPPAFEPASALRSLADDAPPVGWEVESEDAVLALTAGLPPELRDAVRRRFLAAGCDSANRDPVLRRAYRRLAGSPAAGCA